MVPPPPARRPSSQPLVPATKAVSAVALLEGERWRALTWRRGTKGPLKASFAARRVRAADGPAVRLHGRNNQHMPGEEIWLPRLPPGRRPCGMEPAPAAPAGRATCLGRAEVLPRQPAGRHGPEATCRRDQGAPSAGCCRPLLWRRIDRSAINRCASRHTSSSRRSSASTISRVGRGRVCTGTR